MIVARMLLPLKLSVLEWDDGVRHIVVWTGMQMWRRPGRYCRILTKPEHL